MSVPDNTALLEQMQEINRKLDAILELLAKGIDVRQVKKELHLDDIEMRRLYKSINPKAVSEDDLALKEQLLLGNYLAGVEELGLTDAQREVLVDVLVASREAVGKWPRLSKLRERLDSEIMANNYDANSAWVDDAYGWAGQD